MPFFFSFCVKPLRSPDTSFLIPLPTLLSLETLKKIRKTGYVLTRSNTAWTASPHSPAEDIRVETAGQWTRGMCVVDRRLRRRLAVTADEALEAATAAAASAAKATAESAAASAAASSAAATPAPSGDAHGWLAAGAGTRIRRMVASPGAEQLAHELLDRVFST